MSDLEAALQILQAQSILSSAIRSVAQVDQNHTSEEDKREEAKLWGDRPDAKGQPTYRDLRRPGKPETAGLSTWLAAFACDYWQGSGG